MKVTAGSRRLDMEGINEVINLISDDEEDANSTSRAQPVAKRPRPSPPSSRAVNDDDSDIEVVSISRKNERTKSSELTGSAEGDIVETPVATSEPPAADGGNDDDELVVVGSARGVQASVDYPHNRFSCGVKPFGRGVRINRAFCPKCYCYVCDTPAGECTVWDYHCSATDKSPKWRSARAKARPKPPPPTFKKRSNFFTPRFRNRNATSRPINAFPPPLLGGGNRSLMNPISPVSFQDSVLAIIGNPNKLHPCTFHQVAPLRHAPAPPSNPLDSLDAALSLQWNQPAPPPLVPDSLLLPPLVNSNNHVVPGSAVHSQRSKILNTSNPPRSTALTRSHLIVSSSSNAPQGNSTLASPNTVMGTTLASKNPTRTSMGISSQRNALSFNTVTVSAHTAAVPPLSIPNETGNSMMNGVPQTVSSAPLLFNPPPISTSAIATYYSKLPANSRGSNTVGTPQIAPVTPLHRNEPISQPPPQCVQPQRNASIKSVLDNTPSGSPTTTSIPQIDDQQMPRITQTTQMPDPQLNQLRSDNTLTSSLMPQIPSMPQLSQVVNIPEGLDDTQRLQPKNIPTLGPAIHDALSPDDVWSTVPSSSNPLPNTTMPSSEPSNLRGASGIGSAGMASNPSGIPLPELDCTPTPPVNTHENNNAPNGSLEKTPLPPITSIEVVPLSTTVVLPVPTPGSNIVGSATTIPPLPSINALPVPSETESTGTQAEKERANSFLDKLISNDETNNETRDTPGPVESADCSDGTGNRSGTVPSTPVETNELILGQDGPVAENGSAAGNEGFSNTDSATASPMEGISRPEDAPNMQRREPDSPDSSSPSVDSPAVEERIRMRAQQVVMDPLRGLMTMGLEGNGMTMGDLGAVLESGGDGNPGRSNPGN